MIITFVGFMASGKTTVGRILSKKLGCKHIDLDMVCEQAMATPIQKVFAQGGERTFRQLESYYLKKTLDTYSNAVISTGGGVVLNEENCRLIKEKTFSIWLQTTPQKVMQYASRTNKRPLLKNKTLEEISTLFEQRIPFYQRASHISIDTSKYDFKTLLDVIMTQYQEQH